MTNGCRLVWVFGVVLGALLLVLTQPCTTRHDIAAAPAAVDEEAASSIAPAFERLLQDPEAEVRTAAAGNVTAVAKHLPQEMVCVYGLPCCGVSRSGLGLCYAPAGDVPSTHFHPNHPHKQVAGIILPCVQQLVNDTSEHVKAALASVISDLAPLLGPEATKFQLIPMLQPLLKDQHADVRLNVIAKLEAINEVGVTSCVLSTHGRRDEACSLYVLTVNDLMAL